jgi:hypothetical protein
MTTTEVPKKKKQLFLVNLKEEFNTKLSLPSLSSMHKFILHILQDTYPPTHIQRQQNFSVERTFFRVPIESLYGLCYLEVPDVRTF